MFFCEAEPIYEIFEEESVQNLFSVRFSDVKPAWLLLLLGIVDQCYASPGQTIPSESIPACGTLSERQLSAALRYWTKAGVLRKTVSRPIRYKLTDPVPLDENHLLKYVPFAQRIADECSEIRNPFPYEIQLIRAWKTYPGLPEEVILETARTAMELNPEGGLKSAEKLLPYVREAADRQEARACLAEYKSCCLGVREIRRVLGLPGEVSESDITYYVRWTKDWGFSFDDIRQACRAAAQGDPTFPYLNGILRNIKETAPENVHQDIRSDMNGTNNRVAESLNLTRELREILGHVGGGKITKERASEYRMLRDEYGYETVLLAARISGEENRGFDGIGKLLSKWRSLNLNTVEEIYRYHQEIREENSLLAALYQIWGMERIPGVRDRRLIKRWLSEGFSEDLILKAAEYASQANDPPLYAAKVLHQFEIKGISTPEQADFDSETYHKRQKRKK